jgi:RNA-directed DNA polymerase
VHQQWLCKKAEQHIRDVIKERLAPPKARVQSIEDHVQWLNPKIRGWRNYYHTPYSTRMMAKLDFYIGQRLAKWYAKKRQRRRWMSSFREINVTAKAHGLSKLVKIP